MAQESFVKEGNRRLYPRCTRASFKNNSVKHSIHKTPETSPGRLRGDSTERVRHIVSGCSKLAQREYSKHQDKLALQVHWELCRKYGLERTDKKYDHHPLPFAENGELRITWDMTIPTDKRLKCNRPDMTVADKDTQKWTLIDIAVCQRTKISLLLRRRWKGFKT